MNDAQRRHTYGYITHYRVLRDIHPHEWQWKRPFEDVVKAGGQLDVHRWDDPQGNPKTEDVCGYRNPGEIPVSGSYTDGDGWNPRPLSGVPQDAIEHVR